VAKKVLSITVDEKLLAKWKKFTDKNFINSSRLIEKLLSEYLSKQGKTKEGR
jgi:metal-responsive CopG/Arc/MetJ family transcriptional regulator